MKQNKEKFDFKAFGQAIKAARKAKGISRNQLADTLNIAPRYIASIENSGQHPSLQILYELVTLLDVSVDQFFFPEREQEKSTRRRQLDTMLDDMSEKDLKILSATAKGIEEANNETTGGIKFPRFFIEKQFETSQFAAFFFCPALAKSDFPCSRDKGGKFLSKHRKGVPFPYFHPPALRRVG